VAQRDESSAQRITDETCRPGHQNAQARSSNP
jgi:hypothetical protein